MEDSRETQVIEQMANIGRGIDALKDLIKQLQDRLTIVLTEELPSDAPLRESPSLVPLAKDLASYYGALSQFNESLCSILNRLEL